MLGGGGHIGSIFPCTVGFGTPVAAQPDVPGAGQTSLRGRGQVVWEYSIRRGARISEARVGTVRMGKVGRVGRVTSRPMTGQ